ncbi:hypothetical protein ISR94_03995 [Candidatus Microgenomates bacterium]|nr:hypothetical protein [Candidatus Microgenomates bacterium]
MKNTKKILIWSINIALFVTVVYMGIAQAGLGAEMAKLEDELVLQSEKKHQMSESILLGNSSSSFTQKSEDLGFMKPEKVVYIDSIDSVASLLH